jgi:hypothetical protein
MEVARGGAMYISFVIDIFSWQRGAARTCYLRWLDGLAQGGGAVWCHGGIDSICGYLSRRLLGGSLEVAVSVACA